MPAGAGKLKEQWKPGRPSTDPVLEEELKLLVGKDRLAELVEKLVGAKRSRTTNWDAGTIAQRRGTM